MLGFRASAFSDSHGGFINNQLTTRTWVNGAVSNNAALGAQRLQPRARRRRPRGAEGGVQRTSGAPPSPTTTSASPPSAPGTRIRRCRRARSSASDPKSHDFEAKIARLSRGRRRRHRRSGVREHLLVAPHAPAERILAVHAELQAGSAARLPDQEGFTCLNDPYYGTGPTPAATCRLSTTSTTPIRSAGRMSCGSPPSPAVAFTGSAGAVLGEDPRQELRQHLLHAGAAVPTARRLSTTLQLQRLTHRRLAAGRGVVRVHDALGLPADHRVHRTSTST